MARTRDQFTGHVWLLKTTNDRIPGYADVWEPIGALGENLDRIHSHGILTLMQERDGEHSLRCYPRIDTKTPWWAAHATHYKGVAQAILAQAAVNDYLTLSTQLGNGTFDTVARVRRVTIHQATDR